jgi:hypothetical protein
MNKSVKIELMILKMKYLTINNYIDMSKTGMKLRLRTLTGWVNQLKSNAPKIKTSKK